MEGGREGDVILLREVEKCEGSGGGEGGKFKFPDKAFFLSWYRIIHRG